MMTEENRNYPPATWRVTDGLNGSNIWDGDRPIGTVNKDVAQRMAAAQDMLEALEAVRHGSTNMKDDVFRLVLDAIAKAKGE